MWLSGGSENEREYLSFTRVGPVIPEFLSRRQGSQVNSTHDLSPCCFSLLTFFSLFFFNKNKG